MLLPICNYAQPNLSKADSILFFTFLKDTIINDKDAIIRDNYHNNLLFYQCRDCLSGLPGSILDSTEKAMILNEQKKWENHGKLPINYFAPLRLISDEEIQTVNQKNAFEFKKLKDSLSMYIVGQLNNDYYLEIMNKNYSPEKIDSILAIENRYKKFSSSTGNEHKPYYMFSNFVFLKKNSMCLFTIGNRIFYRTYLVEKLNNKWHTVIMMTDDPWKYHYD